MTKIATIRTLAALAAIHGLIVPQMDVKIAFLNGDLKEKIYKSQLETFTFLDERIYNLRKSLYSFKQAPE